MSNKVLGIIIILIVCNTDNLFAQDIIIFKSGDEINAKIIEISSDLVKYKKWENSEGPLYSVEKSEVFMIKYENGTKDVFNEKASSNHSTNQINELEFGNIFIGVWYHKKYDGINNKTTITISKTLEDYLVDCQVVERFDEYFFHSNGSFKEVGRLDGGNIIINDQIKLSLIDENTLLLKNEEYSKTPNAKQKVNANTNTNVEMQTEVNKKNNPFGSYTGEWKDGNRNGKGKQVYRDGSYYDGEWKNDKRNGYGKALASNGELYSGYWKDDKRDSLGVTEWPFDPNYPDILSYKFEGIYKEDKAYNGIVSILLTGGIKKEIIVTNGVWGKSKRINN